MAVVMPTHITALFTPEELSTATLSPPFPFTKGVPLLRVPVIERSPMYRNYGPGALIDRETVLFDLQRDPDQLRPIHDPEVEGRLSGLMAEYERYVASGEVNSTVVDARAKIAEIKQRYGSRDGVTTDDLDGLTVSLPDGSWFNLRPSNTEPLLRLNVEAADAEAMAALRDEVLAVVRA